MFDSIKMSHLKVFQGASTGVSDGSSRWRHGARPVGCRQGSLETSTWGICGSSTDASDGCSWGFHVFVLGGVKAASLDGPHCGPVRFRMKYRGSPVVLQELELVCGWW